MRAVAADGHGFIDVRDVPVPQAREGWVVTGSVGTGVCGTDLRLVAGDYPHDRFPVVPGHESAGIVPRVGAGVAAFAEGDHVGVDPTISCGVCAMCRAGATNLCVDILVVDLAVDAGGHPAAISAAVAALGPRGRLIRMGVASPAACVALSPCRR